MSWELTAWLIMAARTTHGLSHGLLRSRSRKASIELKEAENHYLGQLEANLDEILHGLPVEELAECMKFLPELADALPPRSRATHHTARINWNPEAVEMLMAFCDQLSEFEHHTPHRLAPADLTPPKLVAAILSDEQRPNPLRSELSRQHREYFEDSRSAPTQDYVLGHATVCRQHFIRVNDLLEEYFEAQHQETLAKAQGKPRKSPSRSRARERQDDAHGVLNWCIERMSDSYRDLPQFASPHAIARYVQRCYDAKIQAAARRLNAKTERVSDTAIQAITDASDALYACLHQRWEETTIRYVQVYHPRHLEKRNALEQFGDGSTKIFTPTEIVDQKLRSILAAKSQKVLLNLIGRLDVEVKTLGNKVLALEREQMKQLDDMIEAAQNESNAAEGSENQQAAAQLETVLKQVKEKAKLRESHRLVGGRTPRINKK